MALWDLYLESESWWARKTGWSVYGMICDAGRLLDDSSLKKLAANYEEGLDQHCLGGGVKTIDLFTSLFPGGSAQTSFELNQRRQCEGAFI
jgi:hypothetical protein